MATRKLQLPVVVGAGAECERCIERLEQEVGAAKGVVAAAVDRATSTLRLEYDQDLVSLDALERKVLEIGAGLTERFRHETIMLGGLDCPDCAATLDTVISKLPGVVYATTSLVGSSMRVEYKPDQVGLDQIISRLRSMGYEAEPQAVVRSRARAAPSRPRLRELLTAAAGALLAAGLLCSWRGGPAAACIGLYGAAIVVGGFYVVRAGVAAALGRAVDMNVLMTVAVIGAVAIGEWAEGATVVFLFSLGNTLESQVMSRTRRAIGALLDLAPAQALVRRDGEEVIAPAEQLGPGDVIIVRPGERIATDGVVVSGSSPVNQAPLTGESMPVSKAPGDPVYAGTINGLGALEVKVTRTIQDNTLAAIIELVERAQAQKAPYQRAVDRFARYYTPAVVAAAALVAVIPPLVLGQAFGGWVYRGLALLILSCPCALVISTPVAIVSAVNTAARCGVLIKGGAYLEALGQVRAMAFDKTGTLTVGKPEVTDIVAAPGVTAGEVLELAAAIEAQSEHPLGRAIVARAHRAGISGRGARDFTALAGSGARAVVEGATTYAGSPKLFRELGADLSAVEEHLQAFEAAGKTVVVIGSGGADLHGGADLQSALSGQTASPPHIRAVGVMGVADRPRPGALEAVRRLRELGMGPLVMLTGDNPGTAQAIAEQLGLDDFHASLLPADKVDVVTQMEEMHGGVVAVGDGINDAPALAASTVGVAMGATGSDAALENADVALMSDDLSRLPFAVALGRAARAIIRQNVGISLGVKVALLGLAVPGLLTLWLAVLGDVGVSLVVIANGMRLLAHRP